MTSLRRWRQVLDVLLIDGFRAAPGLMTIVLLLVVVQAVAVPMFPIAVKLAVDAVATGDDGTILVSTLLGGSLIAGMWFCGTLEANITYSLLDRMELFVSTRIARQVSSFPSIDHLERPENVRELDLLEQRRHELRDAPRCTIAAFAVVVRCAVMVIVLATVHPLLAALPLLGIAPAWAQAHAARLRRGADEASAADIRHANDLFALATRPSSAKEVRTYGFGSVLNARHRAAADRVVAIQQRAALLSSLLAACASGLFVVGFTACVAIVIDQMVYGSGTLGQLVLVVVLTQQIRPLLGEIAAMVGTMLTTTMTASRSRWLDDYVAARGPRGSSSPPNRLLDGIRLDGVSFAYGSDDRVLDGFDLHLPAASTVAIVGENGAGKSTLVKLLTGMHEPSGGRILVEGVDLADIDIDGWRGRIAATFQDHVPFELVASEAIGIGDLPRIDDADAIGSAIERAGADDVVSALDRGLETPLGRSFADGIEPSGGQWQKIAIARGVMRDDPLLVILDEPAASLDPVAEHELFVRRADASRRARAATGAITLLISHRLSSVRDADLIVVLAEGGASEIGSHDELIAANGVYAELHRLQARGYR